MSTLNDTNLTLNIGDIIRFCFIILENRELQSAAIILDPKLKSFVA